MPPERYLFLFLRTAQRYANDLDNACVKDPQMPLQSLENYVTTPQMYERYEENISRDLNIVEIYICPNILWLLLEIIRHNKA